MVQPVKLITAARIVFLAAGFFAPTGAFSEEFLFSLTLTRSVTQIEDGKSTSSSLRKGDKGGELFPVKRRVYKKDAKYFHENTYKDGQIIEKEISLLGDNPKQIWFYWPGDVAPRLIVFSIISGSVAIIDVASFLKDEVYKPTTNSFTEVILEYGRYFYTK
jgi:hypothetical protein